MTRRRGRITSTVVVAVALALAAGQPAWAQRAGRGANTRAETFLGELPPVPLYWHLDAYATTADAEAARGARGTVVESLGRVWLFTIAEADWRPAGGERVARIGPLPLPADGRFTATYLDATTAPGFQTAVHEHSGPEALYTISGEACLDTPDGTVVGRAGGEPLIVAGNQPMQLTSTGSEVRRSLVLVLHDAARPWMTPASGWTPTGRCPRPAPGR